MSEGFSAISLRKERDAITPLVEGLLHVLVVPSQKESFKATRTEKLYLKITQKVTYFVHILCKLGKSRARDPVPRSYKTGYRGIQAALKI